MIMFGKKKGRYAQSLSIEEELTNPKPIPKNIRSALKSRDDRDLMIMLYMKVHNHCTQIGDHENRLRVVEKWFLRVTGGLAVLVFLSPYLYKLMGG